MSKSMNYGNVTITASGRRSGLSPWLIGLLVVLAALFGGGGMAGAFASAAGGLAAANAAVESLFSMLAMIVASVLLLVLGGTGAFLTLTAPVRRDERAKVAAFRARQQSAVCESTPRRRPGQVEPAGLRGRAVQASAVRLDQIVGPTSTVTESAVTCPAPVYDRVRGER